MRKQPRIKLLVIAVTAISVSCLIAFAPRTGAQSKRLTPQKSQPRSSPTPPDQQLEEGDTLRINTELVTLTATVTDARGRYVANLKQSDFTVYEDGVKQDLAYFNTGDRVPVSLGIIFDTSGSMIDKIEGVQDAVEHFVKSVSPGDEIFLIRFSEDADLVQDFTDDRRRILRAVEHLEPQGSTALYDAVVLGLERIKQGKNRKRALLLLTDGNDTASGASFDSVVALARRSEVTIYALGIGHGEQGSFGHDPHGSQDKDTVDMRVLRGFAEPTGGAAYFLENAHRGGRDLVDEAANEVANELKQQYTLGYRPKGGSRDSGFHQIKVETADKSLRVRTKRGYYANRASDTAGE